jgi:hypothetical protein
MTEHINTGAEPFTRTGATQEVQVIANYPK